MRRLCPLQSPLERSHSGALAPPGKNENIKEHFPPKMLSLASIMKTVFYHRSFLLRSPPTQGARKPGICRYLDIFLSQVCKFSDSPSEKYILSFFLALSLLVVNSFKPDKRDSWNNNMIQWTSLFSVLVMYLYLHLPGLQYTYPYFQCFCICICLHTCPSFAPQ